MNRQYYLIVLLALAAIAATPQYAKDASPTSLAGVTCQIPPPLHCPDASCLGPMVIEQGTAVEPKTGRKFFLDFPCDLKRGEKVTFILSLHGAGSYGNWQRHYFPIMDYATKYRLVIATPNTPTRVWSPNDDEYLQNIVTLVCDKLGKQNIRAFWLVGHSQGGMTSNRLVRTEFFKERITGWLSLSGGRFWVRSFKPIPASFFSRCSGGATLARFLHQAFRREPLVSPRRWQRYVILQTRLFHSSLRRASMNSAINPFLMFRLGLRN